MGGPLTWWNVLDEAALLERRVVRLGRGARRARAMKCSGRQVDLDLFRRPSLGIRTSTGDVRRRRRPNRKSLRRGGGSRGLGFLRERHHRIPAPNDERTVGTIEGSPPLRDRTRVILRPFSLVAAVSAAVAPSNRRRRQSPSLRATGWLSVGGFYGGGGVGEDLAAGRDVRAQGSASGQRLFDLLSRGVLVERSDPDGRLNFHFVIALVLRHPPTLRQCAGGRDIGAWRPSGDCCRLARTGPEKRW